MEYIITFKNTNFVMKAEQYLLAQNLRLTVLPLPSEISAGCGICLQINQNEIKQALEILEQSNITEIGLYVLENGKYSYAEIKD